MDNKFFSSLHLYTNVLTIITIGYGALNCVFCLLYESKDRKHIKQYQV